MNFQELNFAIDSCKQKLKATDYQAIKHSEGLISDKDYKEIKEQREEWRQQINELETLLPEAKAEMEKALIETEEEMANAEYTDEYIDDTDDIDSLSNGDGIEEEATDET